MKRLKDFKTTETEKTEMTSAIWEYTVGKILDVFVENAKKKSL